MSSRIKLIVGLGNPGAQYERTRHNAGFWFVDELARQAHGQFKHEHKFHGEVCKVQMGGHDIWLLKPLTFMNKSGQAASALARFYRIPVEEILVAHDELDLPPGSARLKRGGGHGGHNGLRDLFTQLGSKEFLRLRIGIGHPGHSSQVTSYVLGKAPGEEQHQIERNIDEAVDIMPTLLGGDLARAMNVLHSKK